MRKMPKQASDRKKGGSGYRGLRDRLAEEVAEMDWWFIADPPKRPMSLLVGPAFAQLLAGKTVVGIVGDEVVLVPAGKLARANSLDPENAVRVPLGEAGVSLDGKGSRVNVAGELFGILTGYEYEALQFASQAGAAMPAWFEPCRSA